MRLLPAAVAAITITTAAVTAAAIVARLAQFRRPAPNEVLQQTGGMPHAPLRTRRRVGVLAGAGGEAISEGPAAGGEAISEGPRAGSNGGLHCTTTGAPPAKVVRRRVPGASASPHEPKAASVSGNAEQ